MADITMCEGKDDNQVCPSRNKCYRTKAKKTDDRQSFFVRLPLILEDGACEHFMPLDK
jgi:hypothetical protein